MNTTYHICFVAPEAYGVFSNRPNGPIGGSEIQQYLIAKAFIEAGHKVAVVVKDVFNKQAYAYQGINVHPCKFRYLSGSNIYYIFDTLCLILLLRQINADFNLLKTPKSILFGMGLHRKLFGGKLIKLMASDMDCKRTGKGLVSYLYPLGAKLLDSTIFQSEYQLKETYDNLGLTGIVIKNIAHGDICKSGFKDIDVLWVGSCSEGKQPQLFLELARKCPEFNFKIVLSNTNNNKFSTEILSSVKAIRNLEYYGQTNYDIIGDIYSRAKVLVSTSIIEGFPNTFLQAWQYGVPVVSLHVDPDNVIKTYKLGYVSKSLDRMVFDLRNLLSDEILRNELGENAIKYMNENHSPKIIVKKYEELFRNILISI